MLQHAGDQTDHVGRVHGEIGGGCATEVIETHGLTNLLKVRARLITQLKRIASKLRQVEHAAHLSPKARPVKLADKIANLRDVADSPPVKWSLARRQEYFDWAKQVVDKIPEPPAGLLSLFMATNGRRP